MATLASNMLHYGTPNLWSNVTGGAVTHCQEQDASENSAKPCSTGMGWILLENSMKGKKYVRSLPSFDKYDWTDDIWHNGGDVGVNTQLVVLPKAGVFVAELTNTDGNAGNWAAQQLSGVLINALLPTHGPSSAPTTSTSPSPTLAPRNASLCGDVFNGVFWVNSHFGYKGCAWLKIHEKWKRNLCASKSDACYFVGTRVTVVHAGMELSTTQIQSLPVLLLDRAVA